MLSNSYPMLQFNLGEDIDMMRDRSVNLSTRKSRRVPMKLIARIRFQGTCGNLWASWVCMG